MSKSNLIKQSTAYVLLGFLAPAVNFILLPIYAHYLLPADYGIIILATLVQSILTNLIGLGANGAFSRIFYDCRNNKKAINALFCNAFIIFTISSVFIIILSSIFGPWLFQFAFKNDVFTFSRYGYIVMLTSLSVNMQLIVLSLYRNQENVKSYAFWAITFFILSALGIYIGVVGLKWGGFGSVIGRSVGLTLPIIIFYINYFIKNKFVFRIYLVKRLLHYGLPLVPYLLLNFAFSNIDKIFVERYFDMATLGIYGFAIQIASVIEIFINAMQGAVYPRLFKELKQNTVERGKNITIKQIFSGVLIVSFVVNAAVITFGTLGITYFINPRYHLALAFLPLSCLVYVPRILYTVWGISIMFYGKTRWMPLMNFMALVIGLASNLVLIPILGIFALPISLFLSQSVMVLLSIWLTTKLKIKIMECMQLQREHFIGLLLVLVTIAALIGYNIIDSIVLWYVPVFFIIGVLIFFLFKQKVVVLFMTVKQRLVVNKKYKANKL